MNNLNSMKKFLTFIDFENEFKKFKSIPTWTKKKYLMKEKLFKFLNNHESLYYEIDYCRPLAEARKRWSYGFFEVPTTSRPRLLYLLPKIHKDYSKWLQGNPPGRPIVSDCSSDTFYLSKLIDKFLAPLSNKHPSYIKDTPDFLDKLSKISIPKQSHLITLDVESLYTNIDNSNGIKAIKALLLKY